MVADIVQRLKQSLQRAAAALREADVPFVLAGSLASWARGGAGTGHDIDLVVKPDDAERALDALAGAGMQPQRPPEGWLYKAYDGDVMIDVIFEPSGLDVNDEVIARADDIEVFAVPMRVMALEDVLVTKLAALNEQDLDYRGLLEVARSLRERIDWADVRARAPANAYVAAFFTLIDELDIIDRASR